MRYKVGIPVRIKHKQKKKKMVLEVQINNISINKSLLLFGHGKICLRAYANNKGQDQPVHLCRLDQGLHCLLTETLGSI